MKHNIQSKYEWQKIIIGIRKRFNWSHNKLAKELTLGRQTISRFEKQSRTPNGISIVKILNFIKRKNLNINELSKIGTPFVNEYIKRQRIPKLYLKESEELAELIGIILGDGEIRPDGTIRISFDPKKDLNFIHRRIIPLIKELFDQEVYFAKTKVDYPLEILLL